MSPLPPNIAQNSAVWAIIEPILDMPVGTRDRGGNEVFAPPAERKVAAQRLLQYLVDQRILFAISKNLMNTKFHRYSRDDMQVIVSMCAVRIAEFVQYKLTRDMITADVIHDTVRPTVGLLTQVARYGASSDLRKEYRDQLTGTSSFWRRNRYALNWQEELRHQLGYEPSTADLDEYFAKRSAEVSQQPIKQAMLVTAKDLDAPPRSESLDESKYSDDLESIAETIAEDDQDAAEARLDAAVAIGMIHRAIRMWAPGDRDARETMHRYASAWIMIRCEPGGPAVVSAHEVVKLTGLSRRVATRMAAAFDEHVLSYVRGNLAPAQAQAHVQRISLVEAIENAIQAWAPGDERRHDQMREFIGAWFRAGRFGYQQTAEGLSKTLSWSRPQTREVLSEFEAHILPELEAAKQQREEVSNGTK